MFKSLLQNTHLFIDLETLSIKQNARVISIGAVYYNPKSVEPKLSFYVNISFNDPDQSQRDIDPDTVKWWFDQAVDNPESLKVFKDALYAPVSTKEALLEFNRWYGQVTKGFEVPLVWGNGVDFDNSILLSLYSDLKITAPFSFRKNMCFRTIYNLMKANDLGYLKVEPKIKHNALEDAKAECETFIKFLYHDYQRTQ